MCLIAFALGASPRWPLVLAANRDEFLARPTAALARWQAAGGQDILSGRDLRAGGTWLGVTPQGRVAFLTNVREGQSPTLPRSRGELVTRWLQAAPGTADAATFADALRPHAADYGGFNLVVGDLRQGAWTWLSNKIAQADGRYATGLHTRTLGPGVYGLSNASLDTPWPKTLALKAALSRALSAPTDDLAPPLWQALADPRRAPASALPHTGVSAELEAALSSAFVDVPGRAYGTRCCTVLTAQALGDGPDEWRVQMQERTPRRDGPAGTGSTPGYDSRDDVVTVGAAQHTPHRHPESA